MNWYLIQTKPNAHLIASKHLNNQNLEVFLPLARKTSKRKREFLTRNVPMFPSYLFIGSNSKEIPWRSINATRGVLRAVTLDGKYRPICHEIINGLKSRCDDEGILKNGTNISVGDKVKIAFGPFSNFICEVEHIDVNQRVWVLLQLMQQKTKTQVYLTDLFKSH